MITKNIQIIKKKKIFCVFLQNFTILFEKQSRFASFLN